MHTVIGKSAIRKPPLWLITPVISLILIGISLYIFIDPWNSYLQLIKLSGGCILLHGVFLIIIYYFDKTVPGSSNSLLAEGILNSLFGAIMLFNPFLNFFLFSYFVGIWITGWGILKIIQSIFQKKELKAWYFISLEGCFAIVIGYLLLKYPFIKTPPTIQWICLLLVLLSILNISVNLINRTFQKNLPIIL
ncbi:DUF308 domain-containing protein [Niabella hibiscisoli]|uniref:DUF308 domain-containing protein n=1 Tax=Niabella hibiscisoli TaxID=1825928 RepID=UPI00374CA8F9